MKTYCSDCGCAVYDERCINCHEALYIADQHYELWTYTDCSDEFKETVARQEREVADRQRRNKS